MTLGLTEMPTIKEIKLILANVRGFTLKKEKREEVPRPSPLPPMSPFSNIRDIVRERDNFKSKDMPLTEDIFKRIQETRGPY
jgi:hypothetical protein|tara:strand:+ start:352 stop:597 length:246 start_codon:yes stop_codon:yes gene_type:complete